MGNMNGSTKKRSSGRGLPVSVAVVMTIGLVVALSPRLLEYLLIHQLVRAGIESPSLRITRLSPRHIQIRDLRLQQDRIRLAHLDLTFSPRELLHGQIDHIRVEGLEWVLHFRDSGLNSGLPAGPPGAKPSPLPALQAIPFSQIEVATSFLIVERNGIALRIPVSGQLATIDSNQFRCDATAVIAGIEVQFEANADLKSGWVHASAQSPGLAGGNARISLRAKIDTRGNLLDTHLALSAENLMAPGLSIPRLQADMSDMGRSLSALIDVAQPAESRLRLKANLLKEDPLTETGTHSWKYGWQLQGALPVEAFAQFLRMDDPLPEKIETLLEGTAQLTLQQNGGWELNWGVTRSRLGGANGDDALTPLADGLLHGKLANLAGPVGEGTLNRDRFQLNGTWPLFAPAPLSFTLSLPLSLQTDDILLHVDQDWTPLPDSHVLRHMAPELGDGNLSGEIRLQMRGDLQTGRLRPLTVIDLRHVSFASKQHALDVDDVSGRIEINRLSPLSTPGNQRLVVDSLRAANLHVGPGTIAFRLEDPQTLLIEKTTWQLPSGGAVAVQGARLDLDNLHGHFDLQFDQVNLIALLNTLTEGKISGSGLFYGRVPLTIDEHRIRPGNGYLYSVPGTGYLQIHDKAWLSALMLYLNEALSSHPYLSLATSRMEEALHDFKYNSLTIDLMENAQGSSAQIKLRGKGVAGDPPQEIDALIVNLEGLDHLIEHALNLRQTHSDTINQTLEEWLDF